MFQHVRTSLSVDMANIENCTKLVSVTLECTGGSMLGEELHSRCGHREIRKDPGSICDDLGIWSLNPFGIPTGTQANQLGTQTLICTATSIAGISMTIDSAEPGSGKYLK